MMENQISGYLYNELFSESSGEMNLGRPGRRTR